MVNKCVYCRFFCTVSDRTLKWKVVVICFLRRRLVLMAVCWFSRFTRSTHLGYVLVSKSWLQTEAGLVSRLNWATIRTKVILMIQSLIPVKRQKHVKKIS